ncbi:hypothetical protein MMC16_004743 [Acarospora aff. strigata]|nr:hypothetical protein [Acarospora aff. strigata]
MDASSSADSRTASFRKRPHLHTPNLDDDTQLSSGNSNTARKRAKHVSRTGEQDLRDFVPLGAGFSTAAGVLEGQGEIETHYISDDSSAESEGGVVVATSDTSKLGGLAPAMNWNMGSKAKIRTTLGGERGQSSVSSTVEKQERAQKTEVIVIDDSPPPVQIHNGSNMVESVQVDKEHDESRALEVNEGESNVDPLMDYSQSIPNTTSQRQTDQSSQQPKRLADLSEQELRLQIRTFVPQSMHTRLDKVRMACYNCGSSTHFGNDCPSRMPGKPVKSSTWSTKGLAAGGGDYLSPVRPTKGRSGQNTTALDAGSEDASENFYRPRITEAPRGRIQIPGKVKGIGMQAGTARNTNNRPARPPQMSRSNLYPPPPRHPDRDESWGPNSYRSRDRHRSVSPQPHFPHGTGGRNGVDRWQRSAAPEPVLVPSRKGRGGRGYDGNNGNNAGSRGGGVYRPMPSAAKNAWVKHRT